MKQGKITTAYNTIMDMYRIKGLPYDTYLDLLAKKRELQIYVDCQAEQEERIAVEISGGMAADGTFPMNKAQQGEFFRQLADIRDTEVKYDAKPIEICGTETFLVDTLGVTGEVMDILDGIITFVRIKEEGGGE